MEDKTINVNDYTAHLLLDKKFQKKELRIFLDNGYIFHNLSGTITKNTLYKVILKAKGNRRFRIFLTDLLSYADRDSITDANFQMLLKFPYKYRATYLSCISHIEGLSFYQMHLINRYPLSYEAFVYLFDLICHFDFFTDEDMEKIIRDNSDIRSIVIDNSIRNAIDMYGTSSKTMVAQKWSEKLKRLGK